MFHLKLHSLQGLHVHVSSCEHIRTRLLRRQVEPPRVQNFPCGEKQASQPGIPTMLDCYSFVSLVTHIVMMVLMSGHDSGLRLFSSSGY